MHIVDITMFYAAEGGGVSTYLNAKGKWLAQRAGVRHSILSPNLRHGPRDSALVRLPGLRLPGLNGYRVPLSVAASARAIAALQPDLVEAGDAGPAAWAALRARRRLGMPAVAFYHSDLPRLIHERFGALAANASRRYLAHLYRQFDLVMAPSARIVSQLQELGISDVVHQPLGIDTAIFSPERRLLALRQRLQLAPWTRLLVFAGRFTPEKKLPVLLDAMRKLGPRYHLLLIGGGADLPPCPHVSRLPFVHEPVSLAHLLASCDVLVHPGDRETFGLIVLEAMACGLPVVAASGGGTAELLDDDTGILVQPNSADALCDAIDALYRRDLQRMAQAAADKARRLYDWDIVMPQLMQRYARLLAARGRADLDVERLCAAD